MHLPPVRVPGSAGVEPPITVGAEVGLGGLVAVAAGGGGGIDAVADAVSGLGVVAPVIHDLVSRQLRGLVEGLLAVVAPER